MQSKFSVIQICASPYCFFYLLLNIQSSFLPFLKTSYVGSYPVDLCFICLDCFFQNLQMKALPSFRFFKLSGKSGKMAVLILFKTNKNTTELLYFEVHLLSSIFALIMHLVTHHNQMNTQLLTVVWHNKIVVFNFHIKNKQAGIFKSFSLSSRGNGIAFSKSLQKSQQRECTVVRVCKTNGSARILLWTHAME